MKALFLPPGKSCKPQVAPQGSPRPQTCLNLNVHRPQTHPVSRPLPMVSLEQRLSKSLAGEALPQHTFNWRTGPRRAPKGGPGPVWTSSKQAERVCSTGPTCLKDTLTEEMGLYHWTPGRSIRTAST